MQIPLRKTTPRSSDSLGVLVTGACGFAGSVLIKALMEHRGGLRITGLDNLTRKGSQTNLGPLEKLGCKVVIGDIRDQALLEGLPPHDWILDCAANPSVLAGVDGSSSRDLVDQNLYGTVNLLELCKKWNAGFTLLSTSRVYSIKELARLPITKSPTRFIIPADHRGPGWSPAGIDETFPTSPPVSLYGNTKLCSELLAMEYGEAFGFPVRINRCGVLAGAGQFGKADQGIFSFWIHSWARKRPLKYIGFGGSGLQVRDCLHPRDLAPVILAQIDRRGNDKPLVCNFAGGAANAMSLKELSSWCAEHLGPPSSMNDPEILSSDRSSRPFDIPWAVLDPSLAAREWNWKPATPLPAILEEIRIHAAENPGWLDMVA